MTNSCTLSGRSIKRRIKESFLNEQAAGGSGRVLSGGVAEFAMLRPHSTAFPVSQALVMAEIPHLHAERLRQTNMQKPLSASHL